MSQPGQWGQPPQGQWQQPQPDPQQQWGQPPQGQWQQPPAQAYQGPPQQGWPGQQYQGPPPQQGGWGAPPQGPWGGQPPQQQEQPGAPVVQGSLAAFFSQPSVGGGPGLKFPNVGDEHYAIVNRTVTSADVTQQTGLGTNANQLLTYANKTPKWVMKVPVNIRPREDAQDGKAQWYCQGAARDLLNAAIARSGAPIITETLADGSTVQGYVPEPGSLIHIKLTGKRKSNTPGINDANVWQVQYWRPDQAAIAAPQLGIEYPSAGELASATAVHTAPAPAEAPTPTGSAPAGNGQAMAQPGPQPGAAQGWQEPAQGWAQPQGQPPAQQPQQQPQPGAPGGWAQPAQNVPQQQPQGQALAGVGAPPQMDWTAQQPTQPPAQQGGYIPQPTQQPQGQPGGIPPEAQQLVQNLTGGQ